MFSLYPPLCISHWLKCLKKLLFFAGCLWLIKTMVARATTGGNFTGLSSLGRGEGLREWEGWQHDPGHLGRASQSASEALHWFPLWKPSRARGDDEMQSAAVLDYAYTHQGRRQHNISGGWIQPRYILATVPGEKLNVQTLSPEPDLERCLETVISLCSSRAHVCEATLDCTGFLSAGNYWESGLCHKPGSTSLESIEFSVSFLKGSSLYFVMSRAGFAPRALVILQQCPRSDKGLHTLQAPACHPEVSGHSMQPQRNLHFSAPSLHGIHVMIGSGKTARVWKHLILKEISPCGEPFLRSGQDSLGSESRNVGRLLAKEAPRLLAQKGGITGMFGGSKLCHCEIGTDRIRNKPLMEKGYKLPCVQWSWELGRLWRRRAKIYKWSRAVH